MWTAPALQIAIFDGFQTEFPPHDVILWQEIEHLETVKRIKLVLFFFCIFSFYDQILFLFVCCVKHRLNFNAILTHISLFPVIVKKRFCKLVAPDGPKPEATLWTPLTSIPTSPEPWHQSSEFPLCSLVLVPRWWVGPASSVHRGHSSTSLFGIGLSACILLHHF